MGFVQFLSSCETGQTRRSRPLINVRANDSVGKLTVLSWRGDLCGEAFPMISVADMPTFLASRPTR